MSELSSTTHPVLPLRDIVVFPHMIVPLFVGREKSVRALEAVMSEDKQILLASQMDPSEDEPSAEGIYRVGVLANVLQLLKLPDGTVKVLVEGKARVRIAEFTRERRLFRGERRGYRRDRGRCRVDHGAEPRGDRGVRALRQAQPQHPRRGGVGAVRRHGGGQARRFRRRASRCEARGKAGAAGGDGCLRPARGDLRPDAGRDVGAQGREEDQEPREDADGAHPARILPQRADEGDPARARLGRRRGPGRRLGIRGEDRGDEALEGGAREVAGRAQEAAFDVADVGRGHGGAQLSRLDAVDPLGQEEPDQEGSRRCPEGARRRPLRAGEGQGPHRRVPGRAVALDEDEGTDPVSRRASGCRQDQPWASRWRRPRGASSSASRSAVCATRRRSAGIGGPISARCPARSSSR